jgi:DNA-binding NarL/FixJ family response regulator
MRILVIESLEVIFEGLKSYFNHHCASSELFWANSPEKAEKMLKEGAYDLLLTELDFEQLDGLELIENLCLRFRLKSVIYTASRNKFRTKWLNNKSFIKGVCYKEQAIEELKNLVCSKESADEKVNIDNLLGLSQREEEVLNFIIQGLNNKLIAARLQLSDKTVATYKHRLLKKLGLQSDYELFAFQQTQKTGFAMAS